MCIHLLLQKKNVENLNELKKNKKIFFDFDLKKLNNEEKDFFIFPCVDKNVFFFYKYLFFLFTV
jgi:hypothetical protein